MVQAQHTFDRDGILVVPHLFTVDDVKAFKQEIGRIVDEVKSEAAQVGRDPKQVLHNGVYVGLAARSALFRQVAGDERILDLLETIIGPNIAFLSDKVVFKNDETDFGSPWHQDWPYWKGSHKTSVWVALDDATPENGCLKVLPGSHRTFVVHDGESSDGLGFGHRLRPGAIDERAALTVAIEAGGAIFFHDLTLHASHPNRSGKDRWALISTYRDAQAREPHYPWAVAAAVVRGEGWARD
jgi:ectoine hydroxylase-related dioxygenase (phytanoyl-CoA dioxygenase family)